MTERNKCSFMKAHIEKNCLHCSYTVETYMSKETSSSVHYMSKETNFSDHFQIKLEPQICWWSGSYAEK